ncbi:TadE/TadG family type IV pilus assembly protein [Bordetella petrii]|uniref:TadE/TadG family type IV pilus assembly protein n=1 Tax=Bordetella petrii TaxID=94624 RepID=UPI00372F165A
MILYAIITYGLVFTAQQSLDLAAQDGARKALQWQSGEAHMLARANAARDVALERAGWIAAMSAAPLQVAVCGSAGALSAAGGGACGGTVLEADQLEVRVSYAYASHPLVPALPWIGAAMVPDLLSARAIVRLGQLHATGGPA